MEAITSAVTSVIGIAETCLTAITGNAVLVVIFASGFVALGLRVLRNVVRSSKSVG